MLCLQIYIVIDVLVNIISIIFVSVKLVAQLCLEGETEVDRKIERQVTRSLVDYLSGRSRIIRPSAQPDLKHPFLTVSNRTR